jgi:toluene monooxygenase system ferredoxin subunit
VRFQSVCDVDDLWEGDMQSHQLDGRSVLLIWPDGGEIAAFQGNCPHQEMPLAEADFDGKTLTCRAHNWQFDAATGKSVNPLGCELARFPVRVDNQRIWVDTDIEVRKFVQI